MGNELGAKAAGRVAVVTGAASGIGLAVSRRCLELGMRVVLADVDAAALERAEKMLRPGCRDGGAGLMSVQCDVGCLQHVQRLADRVYERWGEVGFLFNNAGVSRFLGPGFNPPSHQFSLRDWEITLRVNLWGVIHGLRVFIPRMLAQGTDCVVVNTSSLSGLFNSTPTTGIAYCVSKHAVTLISEALHAELRERGSRISVHVLCPAVVRTNIVQHAHRDFLSEIAVPGAAPLSPSLPSPADKKVESGFDATEAAQSTDPEKRKQLEGMLRTAKDVWLDGATTTDVLVRILEQGIQRGLFYIIVPDERNTEAVIKGLVQLRAGDVVEGRPPLSHLMKEYKALARSVIRSTSKM